MFHSILARWIFSKSVLKVKFWEKYFEFQNSAQKIYSTFIALSFKTISIEIHWELSKKKEKWFHYILARWILSKSIQKVKFWQKILFEIKNSAEKKYSTLFVLSFKTNCIKIHWELSKLYKKDFNKVYFLLSPFKKS